MEEPTAAVRTFIDVFIESIDFLRVLLALARQPERNWTLAELTETVKLPADIVRPLLDRIVAAGLAVAPPECPGTWKYQPRAAEFDEMVQELIRLDDHRPVTLIRLVYARRASTAQAFADAFRFRKD